MKILYENDISSCCRSYSLGETFLIVIQIITGTKAVFYLRYFVSVVWPTNYNYIAYVTGRPLWYESEALPIHMRRSCSLDQL